MREGGSQPLWLNLKNGVTQAVPRHSEIKESLPKKILNDSRRSNNFTHIF